MARRVNDQPRNAAGRPDGGTWTARERPEGVGELREPDWRDQTVIVRGQQRRLGEVAGGRLFHGSARDLPIGTVLSPQAADARNHRESPDETVSITSDLATAAHWARAAHGTETFIYEVEPVGDVEGHRVGLADQGRAISLIEGRVAAARIIGLVPRPSGA